MKFKKSDLVWGAIAHRAPPLDTLLAGPYVIPKAQKLGPTVEDTERRTVESTVFPQPYIGKRLP